MRTCEHADHFGDTFIVAFARGQYEAFENTYVAMCTVEDGELEPYADVSINVRPMADPHVIAVDTEWMPGLDAWLVENGHAIDCQTPVSSGRVTYPAAAQGRVPGGNGGALAAWQPRRRAVRSMRVARSCGERPKGVCWPPDNRVPASRRPKRKETGMREEPVGSDRMAEIASMLANMLDAMPDGAEVSTSELVARLMGGPDTPGEVLRELGTTQADVIAMMDLERALAREAMGRGVVLDKSAYDGMDVGLPHHIPFRVRRGRG